MGRAPPVPLLSAESRTAGRWRGRSEAEKRHHSGSRCPQFKSLLRQPRKNSSRTGLRASSRIQSYFVETEMPLTKSMVKSFREAGDPSDIESERILQIYDHRSLSTSKITFGSSYSGLKRSSRSTGSQPISTLTQKDINLDEGTSKITSKKLPTTVDQEFIWNEVSKKWNDEMVNKSKEDINLINFEDTAVEQRGEPGTDAITIAITPATPPEIQINLSGGRQRMQETYASIEEDYNEVPRQQESPPSKSIFSSEFETHDGDYEWYPLIVNEKIPSRIMVQEMEAGSQPPKGRKKVTYKDETWEESERSGTNVSLRPAAAATDIKDVYEREMDDESKEFLDLVHSAPLLLLSTPSTAKLSYQICQKRNCNPDSPSLEVIPEDEETSSTDKPDDTDSRNGNVDSQNKLKNDEKEDN